MEEVKLSPVEDFLLKYPHMLSGGQQQRVVIARAMIMEPRFLVADEPVSMLDASVRVEILKLLRGLQETHNLSVIYITHDLSTVSYFSERIFVMYAGNLVEKANVRQVLDHALHPYTMALLTGTSEPDAKNAETFKQIPPGEPPSLVNPPTGCRFHPRCPKFMPGICDVKEPPDFEPEPGHLVKCWLYDNNTAEAMSDYSIDFQLSGGCFQCDDHQDSHAALEFDPYRFYIISIGSGAAFPHAGTHHPFHLFLEFLFLPGFLCWLDPGRCRGNDVRSDASQVGKARIPAHSRANHQFAYTH